MDKPVVTLVGDFASPASLESSYERAFRAIGWDVRRFDMPATIRRHCRLGRVGQRLNALLPIEPWIRKANREFVLAVQEMAPKLVVLFGPSGVNAGALAQISSATGCKLTWIWPDTLLNLTEPLITALPLYDVVGSYSERSLPVLRALGARSPAWIPLAADPDLHAPVSLTEEDRRVFGCDVAFVGNWRPEREVLLAALSTRSNLDVKIWGGTSWEAPSRADRRVAKAWQKRLVLGADFAKACVGAKVNLNLIDPTNYPAANMRFFEIPSTGSLEVSSKCPEFQGDLRDRKHIFYYESAADLPSLLDALLTDEPLRSRVAAEGHRHVLENHTYRDRAQRIVELALGESKGAPARSGPADERIVSSS